jgi:aryl-phospho-beta-D-glucosidase BglC (GH1 family)
MDGQGHAVLLRGAQIAGPLNSLADWQAGQDPRAWLNPMTFEAMRSWKMNALRLPVSGWYYQDPRFVPLLDSIVSQANQAGLYVILALFDDAKSGSPYGQGAQVPKAENVTFWKVMAAHFAGNPMLLFDVFNEPTGLTAQTYLTGGGTVTGSTGEVASVIGLQPLVDAIRSVGAQQVVIAPAAIPASDPAIRIQDANVMYTLHIYSGIAANNAAVWDQQWGSLLGHYPLFYGEWTVLPNSHIPQQCRPYTPANAAPLTQAFLSYMDARQINWTAWQFRPYALVQDMTSFTPTTFQGTWTPCDPNSHAGMGEVVKAYLLQGS